MKVKATQRGYYGTLREAGEAFDLTTPKHFSKVWMVETGKGDTGKASKASPEPPKAPLETGNADG